MNSLIVKAQVAKYNFVEKVKDAMKSKKGEGYVDTGVKVLMAVVIGALVLGGLYLLFDKIILPTMNKKVTEMFDYKG